MPPLAVSVEGQEASAEAVGEDAGRTGLLMSDYIQIKKLKRIMYSALRWRLQLPNYVPHYPIPGDDELSEFSRGVKCAYRDLLEEIDKIESAENQRRLWSIRRKGWSVYGDDYSDVENESFLDEIRKH